MVLHWCTWTVEWAGTFTSYLRLWHAQMHGETSLAPPLCSLCLALNCTWDAFPQRLFSLAGLHLCQLSLQQCQRANIRKTRQAAVLSRLAWSVPTAGAEGPWVEFTCPQGQIRGPAWASVCHYNCKSQVTTSTAPQPRANLLRTKHHMDVHGLEL